MSHADIVVILMAIAAIAILVLGFTDGPCRCGKCAFHVNERRMAKVKQEELSHDVQHKGWGFKTGAEDQYPCTKEECPRNPKR